MQQLLSPATTRAGTTTSYDLARPFHKQTALGKHFKLWGEREGEGRCVARLSLMAPGDFYLVLALFAFHASPWAYGSLGHAKRVCVYVASHLQVWTLALLPFSYNYYYYYYYLYAIVYREIIGTR